MKYVDGFVVVLPERNLPEYKRIAVEASKVWMEYGALSYVEAIGEEMLPTGPDGDAPGCGTFPRMLDLKDGETCVFAYITCESKAKRDEINQKVMADPRLSEMCDPNNMPFEMERMYWGGFEVIVEGEVSAKPRKKSAKKKTAKKKASKHKAAKKKAGGKKRGTAKKSKSKTSKKKSRAKARR